MPETPPPNSSRIRLALLPDFPEENWPSMDLVAEQLFNGLTEFHADRFVVHTARPTYRRRASALVGPRGAAQNIDRLFNRFVTYPRYAKKLSADFDLFHLCDHSYSQLLHALPANRTGVYCHDLDTFKCLLDPTAEPRPGWFKAMVRRTLSGFQKARVVFYSTQEIRRQILQFGLIDPAHLIQAPPGIAAEFSPLSSGLEIPGLRGDHPFLLHVGSCIPRKRIDVLLHVFARVRQNHPTLRLLKVGGEFTTADRSLVKKLGLSDSISAIGFQSREVVAECYRRSAAVLITSEAEGFGLPLVEALACGAVVVASDIPVLREVGNAAAVYAPVADLPGWTSAAERILADATTAPPRDLRLARAAQFSWRQHAATIAAAYEALAAENLDASPRRP